MTEIRCPMCGKSVAEELDVCPFCQARLKPLIISSQGEDEKTLPAEDLIRGDYSEFGMDGDTAFNDQNEISSIESPDSLGSNEPENELPSWLLKLRSQTGHKEPVQESESVDQVESYEPEISDTPQDDMLDETIDQRLEFTESDEIPVSLETGEDIRTDDDVEQEAIPENKVEEETSDWLSGLAQTALEEDEKPAWFSNIKDLPQKEQEPSERKDENSLEDDEDRVSTNLDESDEQQLSQSEPTAEESVYDEGMPDWMKDLQTEVDSRFPSPLSEEDSQLQGEQEESPDWLDRLQAETQLTEASDDGTDSSHVDGNIDWLGKMSGHVEPASEEVVAPISETPEWLRILQEETQAFEEDIQPEEPESQAGSQENQKIEAETMDWLKDLQPATKDNGGEGEAGPEFPDWLTQNTLESQELHEEQIQPSTEIPDWLDNITSETPEDLDQESTLPEAETPDWLGGFASELQESTLAENIVVETGSLSDSISGLEDFGSAEIRDMIPGETEPGLDVESNLERDLVQEPTSQESHLQSEDNLAEFEVGDLSAVELADHLSDLHADTGQAEIPGWLRTLDSDSGTPFSSIDDELETEPDMGEITPADIPSWVKEMQPIESLMADVEDSEKDLEQITETAGPLAGLPGVLPTTPGLGNLRKPLNYSIKLRVTDDQSLQAEQLEQLLGTEGQAGTFSRVDKKLPRRILRWVVAILVLLTVSLPIISGLQITSPLVNYPPELLAAREILYGLPPNSPVLLVFDYEPAYSGELEVTAAPILENLIFSGARLAMLSTNPTGPALAENLLKITRGQQDFQSNVLYTNLGYLAGGASGVLSFVMNPSQTIPIAMDGSLPWQSSLLFDVQSLADFKTVIILTDNSDTARIWVEQAGLVLEETPLLMAISAQAEPMIRPYYDSKQIKGLVTGLAGGKAFEQTLQISGLSQKYWEPFSYGLFLAELTILFSALWSAVVIWQNRKSSVGEEE